MRSEVLASNPFVSCLAVLKSSDGKVMLSALWFDQCVMSVLLSLFEHMHFSAGLQVFVFCHHFLLNLLLSLTTFLGCGDEL